MPSSGTLNVTRDGFDEYEVRLPGGVTVKGTGDQISEILCSVLKGSDTSRFTAKYLGMYVFLMNDELLSSAIGMAVTINGQRSLTDILELAFNGFRNEDVDLLLTELIARLSAKEIHDVRKRHAERHGLLSS